VRASRPRSVLKPHKPLLAEAFSPAPDDDRRELEPLAAFDTLEAQLLAFGRLYEQIAAPFHWKFTRADLERIMAKVDLDPVVAPLAA
jgi:hypothetical protein